MVANIKLGSSYHDDDDDFDDGDERPLPPENYNLFVIES